MISEGGGDDDGVIAEHSPPLEASAKEGATSIISSVPSAPGSSVPPPSVECTEERLASSCLLPIHRPGSERQRHFQKFHW